MEIIKKRPHFCLTRQINMLYDCQLPVWVKWICSSSIAARILRQWHTHCRWLGLTWRLLTKFSDEQYKQYFTSLGWARHFLEELLLVPKISVAWHYWIWV
jgi:hypothetical protein